MKGPRGITCPRCQGRTEVIDTRENARGIRRRRACLTPGCGGRVSTLELQVPSGSAIDGRDLALVEVRAMRRAITALSLLDEQLTYRPGAVMEPDPPTDDDVPLTQESE